LTEYTEKTIIFKKTLEIPVNDDLKEKERSFVEEVGLVFEKTGLPRMAGRMFGWLLISEPPYQSPDELAATLMASKGSISTTVRLLSQLGLVERYVIPGERHDHFRIHEQAINRTVKHGLEEEIKMFRELAERGLVLMKDQPAVRREWLEEIYNCYAFLEKEFPALMERYEKKRKKSRPVIVIKGS
jgi:DNA-binding MarR family transcriptional regulator